MGSRQSSVSPSWPEGEGTSVSFGCTSTTFNRFAPAVIGRDAPSPVMSHGSALWLWRTGWEPVRRLGDEEAAEALARPPSRAAVDSLRGDALYPQDKPLHVFVDEASNRRVLAAVTAHAVPARCDLPRLDVVEAAHPLSGRTVLSVSPAVSWAQVATSLAVPRAREIAWELTGTYRIDPAESLGLAERKPLASVADCRHAAAVLAGGGVPWRVRARLAGVLDGAASPMEGRVGCLLVAGRRCGGYGLPRPRLNARIDLEGDERRLAGSAFLRPDYLWEPEGTVLEYDSDAAHFDDGGQRARHDAHKRNVYEGRGWSHFALTRDQLMNPAAMDGFVRSLAKALGARPWKPSNDELDRRQRLRDELFGVPAA